MKIAIVGGIEERWKPEEKIEVMILIRSTLKRFQDWGSDTPILVSGHSPKGGVDIWAEKIAKELGIPTEIYPPEVNDWNDENVNLLPGNICRTSCNKTTPHKHIGYKSRNLQIAQACDVLWCFEPARELYADNGESFLGTSWDRGGGRFTATEAKKLGKKVFVIVVGEL